MERENLVDAAYFGGVLVTVVVVVGVLDAVYDIAFWLRLVVGLVVVIIYMNVVNRIRYR